VFGDGRGYFIETFNQKKYQKIFQVPTFIQDNESSSKQGVLRGLHFQKPPFAQAKLVRCIRGEVLDIAVDLRKGSKTFGQSQSVLLSDKTKHQFFIPRGFAHGFVVLSEEAIFSYKVDNDYAPEYDGGVRFDDPWLDLDWQIAKDKVQLSDKDQVLPFLNEIESPF
jgi:dTDP-4-dehydrorhamnose 3,5-epimerase